MALPKTGRSSSRCFESEQCALVPEAGQGRALVRPRIEVEELIAMDHRPAPWL
jgi:hypothetical protein